MSDSKSLTLSLYLLERVENILPNENVRCVVAATSEQTAREIANAEAGSEGYVWTDGQLVQARDLGVANDGVEGVVLMAKE